MTGAWHETFQRAPAAARRAYIFGGYSPHRAPQRDSVMPVEIGDARPRRDVMQALLRGFGQRCPACGAGSLFGRYLKVRNACPGCGEALYHHRADDAPAYFTILIVGHLVVGAILPVERMFAPPLWLHAVLWLPLTLLLTLWLLPRIKGTIVGLQWSLYMHGFGEATPGA
jgi:uncharacterized protein (DUF983 family)